MRRVPKRIPNDCRILDKFDGTLPELKSLLFILSKAWDYGSSSNEKFIPYRDFSCLGKSFCKSASYVSGYVRNAVNSNRWLREYIGIKYGDNGCFVVYKEPMCDVISDSATNFYQIYMEDVSQFTRLLGLRLYLLYMRDRNRINVISGDSVTYTGSKFQKICGVSNIKSLYTVFSRCSDEFSSITGVNVSITKNKRDDMWNITYSHANNSYDNSLEGE